jgi:hypothetical protein
MPTVGHSFSPLYHSNKVLIERPLHNTVLGKCFEVLASKEYDKLEQQG